MKIYKNFISLYNVRKEIPNQGWIYIKEEDFQDLENATFFIFDENELTPDDYIETEDSIVPIPLYNQFNNSISTLVLCHIFKDIYENMDNLNRNFTIEDKIEALYYYIEEDTFLW